VIILGIDSSDQFVSVGLAGSKGVIISRSSGVEARNKNILHGFMLDVLTQKGLSLHDIGGVAIAIGPGSFTGLRVGLAAAKGLCWSMNIPLAGISSIGAVAGCSESGGDNLLAVKDARRGEFYYGGFAVTETGMSQTIPDSLGSADDIFLLTEKEYKIVGPGVDALKKSPPSRFTSDDEFDCSLLGGEIARQGRASLVTGKKLDISEAAPNYIRIPGYARERK
jgi:tRNA threonylcarbamoyl adenosine modification protein YeaZ